jgi:Fe-S-cluster containining protein
MSDDTLRASMVPILRPLLSELFDGPAVPEPRATCDDCAMCDKGEPALVQARYFEPSLKCCTFHPHLPNYLVGGVLAETDPAYDEGKRRLRKKIAERIGVMPYWLSAPRKYNVAFAKAKTDTFGRDKTLLCPYFEAEEKTGGRCTIWEYREGVCSTFFCKYADGARGYNFWMALKEYLGAAEFLLARYAAAQIDAKVSEPRIDRETLTKEDEADLPPTDADYRHHWGKWVGREEEFYVECYKRVASLRRRDYRTIVDDLVKAKEMYDDVAQKYKAVNARELPPRLVRNPKMRAIPAEDKLVVTTFNALDSFALDKDLYEVLAQFDPLETVEATLERLSREGIELAPELLEALYSQGVLVPPIKIGTKKPTNPLGRPDLPSDTEK